jgi:phage terminase large subunit-like protein
MIENRFVTSESPFIDMAWWDTCVDANTSPVLEDKRLSVYVGVDASVKRDSTAIVVASYDREAKKVRLITHKIFQPSPDDPLDFEATVETTILSLYRRFRVRQVLYDPYQMAAVAQRLARNHVPMVEYPQSVPNLTEVATNLYELFKGRNLIIYPDDAIRLAVSRTVASESARGWKLTKEKQSHKIDAVVALAMAAHGAVQDGINAPLPMQISDEVLRLASMPAGYSRGRANEIRGASSMRDLIIQGRI